MLCQCISELHLAFLFGDDSDLPDYVVTAHDIDPYFRVKMQGVIQKYIDTSISSTVNLKAETNKETVADIYMTAYKAGLKGITVYRESSREGILITEDQKEKEIGNSVDSSEEKTLLDSEKHDNLNSSRSKKNLRPRFRPGETQGVTKRIRTGEGSLYITINEDEHGLCEVFTTIGKAGGNAAAQSEAISRLISLSLRSGIDPSDVVKQLKGISGPNPTWENGQLILSTPDAIGKALESYLKEIGTQNKNDFPKFIDKTNEIDDELDLKKTKFTMIEPSPENTPNYNPKTMTTCPDCGSNIQHEGGCVTCVSCGFSKCE